jgi:DMSO/TMAO reductase YedYZ molybdopterin-dependent catalytic subunit
MSVGADSEDGGSARPDLPTRGQRTAGKLPPGQALAKAWPVRHYGRVPNCVAETWDFEVTGATADSRSLWWSYENLLERPQVNVSGDFHCVTGVSVLGVTWTGVSLRDLLAECPPTSGVSHVLVWAEFGYSANLRLSDVTSPTAILAHSRDGAQLRPDQGWPLRLVVPELYAWKGPKWLRGLEYLGTDRRGFWEERGYHNVGDPWLEQRYSHQEKPGEGPPIS